MELLMHGGHVCVGVVSIPVSTAVHFALMRERSRQVAVQLILMYSIGIPGFRGIFGGFVVHTIFAHEVAASIGWEASTPFQTEVAWANLAVGVLGVCGF